MDAIKRFINEYPEVSRETLVALAEYFKERNKALANAINELLNGNIKSAIFIFKHVIGSTISIDASSISALLIAKLIYDRLSDSDKIISAKSLIELKKILKKYDSIYELLRNAREIYRLASSKLAKRIAELLMKDAIDLCSSGKKILLSSLILNYALKFAELAGDDVTIGKVKYNLAVVLMKAGKEEEPKRLAREAYKIFERLSQISEEYVKNFEIAKRLCEKLNCF